MEYRPPRPPRDTHVGGSGFRPEVADRDGERVGDAWIADVRGEQATAVFYVNIANPPQIAVVDAGDPSAIHRVMPIPRAGPHGLDLDVATRRLFCACDGRQLVEVDADSGDIVRQVEIGGAPDVVFFNAARRRLYVAIGDPGIIEVVDADAMQRRETVRTERGAHTLAFDASSSTVYAFLPDTHRAAVYVDRD
jgi:hypothetical protein